MARRKTLQSEVASHLGISQTAVSKRLAGTIPFDINELVSIAELLGVNVAVLLPFEEPATDPNMRAIA